MGSESAFDEKLEILAGFFTIGEPYASSQDKSTNRCGDKTGEKRNKIDAEANGVSLFLQENGTLFRSCLPSDHCRRSVDEFGSRAYDPWEAEGEDDAENDEERGQPF